MRALIAHLSHEFLPPALFRVLMRGRARIVPAGVTFSGDYATWDDALRDSSGYDNPAILERVRDALLKVKAGEAAFERDTVLFREREFVYPLLAGLLHGATKDGNRLSVMDFGGSLGSTYFQHRPYFGTLRTLRWSVIEQPHFVACGEAHFADDTLRFYGDPEACARAEQPNVLLLSGVLEYLPDPLAMLVRLAALDIATIVIDRTLLVSGKPGRLMVQRVPPSIYDATYPCWVLNREAMLARLAPQYRVFDEFRSTVGSDVDLGWATAEFKGFVLDRI